MRPVFGDEPGGDRPVFLYFVRADRYVKVGICRRGYGRRRRQVSPLLRRMRQLQAGNPHRLEVLGFVKTVAGDEPWAHFDLRRWHVRGEWFELTGESGQVVWDWLYQHPGGRFMSEPFRKAYVDTRGVVCAWAVAR